MNPRAEYQRQWYLLNKEREQAKHRAWHAANRARSRHLSKERYYENRSAVIARTKAYRKRKWKTYLASQRQKRASNPSFRIKCSLRTRLGDALRGKTKSDSTLNLLGCSIENLWLYLESTFQEGMTRENYGKVWHVDHIMPCAIFDLSKPEHQRRCFHFSNLQPLFARENHIKNAKCQIKQFNLL